MKLIIVLFTIFLSSNWVIAQTQTSKPSIVESPSDCLSLMQKHYYNVTGLIPDGKEAWSSTDKNSPRVVLRKTLKIDNSEITLCEDRNKNMSPGVYTRVFNSQYNKVLDVEGTFESVKDRAIVFKSSFGNRLSTFYYCQASNLFHETACPTQIQQLVNDQKATCKDISTDDFLLEKAELLLKFAKKDANLTAQYYDCVKVLNDRINQLIATTSYTEKESCDKLPTKKYKIFKFLDGHPSQFTCGAGSLTYCSCLPSKAILSSIEKSPEGEQRLYEQANIFDRLGGVQFESPENGDCGDGDCPPPDETLGRIKSLCEEFKTAKVRSEITGDIKKYLTTIHSSPANLAENFKKSILAYLSQSCR